MNPTTEQVEDVSWLNKQLLPLLRKDRIAERWFRFLWLNLLNIIVYNPARQLSQHFSMTSRNACKDGENKGVWTLSWRSIM